MNAALPENVRLIVWDLDETFWQGTLAEGEIQPIARHVEMVKELSGRGIVNAIASKNELSRVQAKLTELGLTDYFVFVRAAFAPKGPMLKSIIESSQLRAETIFFVDDNPGNLQEVSFYNPGIQVAGPEVLPGLLEDSRFLGKPDPEMARLAHYKVLERKQVDRDKFVDNQNRFLHQSEIQLSFHYDVLDEFERMHEMVNRTNQLNFTKVRWSEDPVAARLLFETQLQARDRHAAYVKVSDKYGDYGICGFFVTKGNQLEHFAFSCRTMNMGVEHVCLQETSLTPVECGR
jgi:FkbH-like protein